jgi:hypothetical protein
MTKATFTPGTEATKSITCVHQYKFTGDRTGYWKNTALVSRIWKLRSDYSALLTMVQLTCIHWYQLTKYKMDSSLCSVNKSSAILIIHYRRWFEQFLCAIGGTVENEKLADFRQK